MVYGPIHVPQTSQNVRRKEGLGVISDKGSGSRQNGRASGHIVRIDKLTYMMS